MKALITGGAGFIGYHLTKNLLQQGYHVVLVDNFSRGVEDYSLKKLVENAEVEVCSVDLMDKEKMNDIGRDYDYIYHLAAIIGVQNVLNNSYDVLKKNVELVINMIEFAEKQKNLRRFVFASTSEIYAGTLQYFHMDIPTPEATPLAVTSLEHPRTSYMLSKIYGEALLRQSRIPFTIVRPHNFYGPRMGMSHVIPELLKKAYFMESGGSLEVFSVEHQRTFCYIDDAVEMIRLLAECDQSLNEAYNVGNEAPEIRIGQLADIILRTVQKPLEITPLPASPGSPARRCPSMKKTWDCIKCRGKITLEDGVQKTYEWYRDHIFDKGELCAQ